MMNAWCAILAAILIALGVGACGTTKSEKLVHKETMVIKKEGVEEKKKVRDPTDAGVEDDSPVFRYTPE